MIEVRKIDLVYSPTLEQDLSRVTQHPLIDQQAITIRTIEISEMSSHTGDSSVELTLLWLEPEDYPSALQIACQYELSVAFLPVNGARPLLVRNLDLPNQFDDCLKLALSSDSFAMDIIACQGVIVINGVSLINQTTMAEFIDDSEASLGLDKISLKFKRFIHAFSLKPQPVTFITAKDKTISTAITGFVLLDFHEKSALFRLFKESVSLRDKRLSVILFAPQSILSYLKLSLPTWAVANRKLDQQIGYIRSESLLIKTRTDTHFLVNNKPLTTQELKLEILPKPLYVKAGEGFRAKQSFHDDKENVSCDQLPQQEERIRYLSGTLPFFSHALETDFKELFLSLKDNSKISHTFVLLMVLSALLATLGLFLNSPSVVIGAMVLAPLMAPIVSLAMGILRSDVELGRRSLITLLNGIGIVLILSALTASILPFQQLTNEIQSRINPSTLDLLVAILSGVAGALAHARENIAKSLPGVAIAVALVPPLCVSGIGIGWQNYQVFSGALLLFLTNLTGIILAAGFSFMFMGFAPFSRAKKGIFLSLTLVAIISVPLFYSFANMVKMAEIENTLLSKTLHIADADFQLRNITLLQGQEQQLQIHADLICFQPPDEHTFALIETELSQLLQRQVAVDLAVRIVSAPKPKD